MKKFEVPENSKSIHFIFENLNFPIILYGINDWDETQIAYLNSNLKSGVKFTTESICKWCINHSIQFRIMYPFKKTSLIKNPYKALKYIVLKLKLKKY